MLASGHCCTSEGSVGWGGGGNSPLDGRDNLDPIETQQFVGGF